jgi:predicted nucleic acid-binding protein
MILYLDSSALVKKYVREKDSEAVLDALRLAEVVALSMVGYAEVMAALFRRQRENANALAVLQSVGEQFKRDWRSFAKIELTESVNEQAELLLSRHALRGFDAIHLASALVLAGEVGRSDLTFVCADTRLLEAARREGLGILPLPGTNPGP